MERRNGSRLEAWAPVASGVFLAVPVLAFRYPPMGDLAFHEAGVALLRHFGDPRFAPTSLYALNLGEPNQLFHMAAWALSFVLSTDTACKVVVAMSTLGVAAGASQLASHLGVSRWGAVVVAPLALGWMSRWGLVANLAGLATLLFCLPALDRAATEPTPARAMKIVGMTVLLFFAHESSMLELAVAAVVFAARTPRRARDLALALAPVLVAALLAALYAVRSSHLKAPSILAVEPVASSWLSRAALLPASLFGLGHLSGLMLFACVAGLLVVGLPGRPSPPRDRRYVVLGIGFLGAYFAMPEAAFGSTLIHERFLAPAFAILALSALPARDAPPRAAALVLLLPPLMLWATWPLFVAADRMYRDLDAVLAPMADGCAVAQLDLTPREPSVVAPVVGAAARALAVHGGRLLFSFTDAPTYPLTIPPSLRWDEPVSRLEATPFAFAPAFDLTRFRYALCWAPMTKLHRIFVQAFAPEAHLVVEQGGWMLFESNLQVDSILSPDAPLPSPSPEPLAARVRALISTAQGQGSP